MFPRHYKHNKIARFTVGKFHFVNHLITIENEEDHERFLAEVAGLLMVDQVNIVEILNLENERPVSTSGRTTRGALGSNNVKMSDSVAEGKSAELDRREQELMEREANLAARERRIPNQPEGFDGTKSGDGVVAQAAATDPGKPETESTPAPTPGPRIGGLKLGGA